MQDKEILFGKFEIIECLKKDSFSSVFKAFDNSRKMNVLLKVLDTDKLPDTSIFERFKREGRILSKLEHPGIIRVIEFNSVQNLFYISFEFFESRNLRDFLKYKSISFEQKKILIAQLITALDFAHKNNIIHRDLKPENILVNDLYELKIADFGLARITNENTLTNQTSIVGTPAYMSPEQIKGEELTVRSDLFSLGILTYELITGKNPFYGSDVGSTINNILTFDTNDLFEDVAINDDGLIAILFKLLQVEPDERIDSAVQCLPYLGLDNYIPASAVNIEKKQKNKSRIAITILITFVLLAATSVFFSNFNTLNNENTKANRLKTPFSGYTVSVIPLDSAARNPDTMDTHTVITEEQPDTQMTIAEENSDTLSGTSEEYTRTDTVKGETSSTPDSSQLANGKLFIEARPWATIFINSRRYDTTPLQDALSLRPGAYNVTLVHPDYPPVNRQITIEPEKSEYIRINFALLIGYLRCSIYPWGNIYVDGELKGTSPLRDPIPLAPGTHLITISNPDYGEVARNILIEEQQTYHLKHSFIKEDN